MSQIALLKQNKTNINNIEPKQTIMDQKNQKEPRNAFIQLCHMLAQRKWSEKT
jgi:hypothetical protein